MATDEQVSSERVFTVRMIKDPPPPIDDPSQPMPAKYSTEHVLEAKYNQWANDISYFTDEGICVCMVAGAPGTKNTDGTDLKHEKIRYGKPITKIVITGTAEREKMWPLIPHWDLSNENIICESHRIQTSNPHQILNETQIYRVQWEYVYKALRPFTAVMGMPAGTSPAENETCEQHVFDPITGLRLDLNDMSFVEL